MRVKKQKQVRRHVRFFKACCGFREPFKVLCDGNFVHAALTARMGGLQDALPNFLGSAAKAFVTRFVNYLHFTFHCGVWFEDWTALAVDLAEVLAKPDTIRSACATVCWMCNSHPWDVTASLCQEAEVKLFYIVNFGWSAERQWLQKKFEAQAGILR